MLDPITLTLLQGRLRQIADEMDASFERPLTERREASHGLHDPATGETIVQGRAGPDLFIDAMTFAAKAAIEKAKARGGAQNGDVWLLNDPHSCGLSAAHMRLARPFFSNGEALCWLTSCARWGGEDPERTLLIPPVRLIESGALREDVADILIANARAPLAAGEDLSAQIAALDHGAKRLRDLIDEYGEAITRGALVDMRARAVKAMRAHVAAWPSGIVSVEDFLDGDGFGDDPVPIVLDMSVDGKALVFDFSRSSPALRGPPRPTMIAACAVALRRAFDLPPNAGALEPVRFVIPEGSPFAARAPKPVGAWMRTAAQVTDLVLQALASIAPERASAGGGRMNALSAAQGGTWPMSCVFEGGRGGHEAGDGLPRGGASMGAGRPPSAEILEAIHPVKVRRWALRRDSGGAGWRRGGLGASCEIECLGAEAMLSVSADQIESAPCGAVGGFDGARAAFSYEAEKGCFKPLVRRMGESLMLKPGCAVRVETPGGGGYGSPFERDPADVARDAVLGYVSVEAARRDYGVVLRRDGEIDPFATAAHRSGRAA